MQKERKYYAVNFLCLKGIKYIKDCIAILKFNAPIVIDSSYALAEFVITPKSTPKLQMAYMGLL